MNYIKSHIEEIESDLKAGQTPPQVLAQHRDWLASESSSKMDRQDELIDRYADWFHANRNKFKSDKAADNEWDRTELGREMRRLETFQKRVKLLIGTIVSHLRVADMQARNLM